MPVSAGSFMERHRFGNSDLMISAIGAGRDQQNGPNGSGAAAIVAEGS
jgi:hypothetical protein